MTTAEQIFSCIQVRATFLWQMSFDYAGFLVGRRQAPVSRVVVALDITPEVSERRWRLRRS